MATHEGQRRGGIIRSQQPGFSEHLKKIQPLGGKAVLKKYGREWFVYLGRLGAAVMHDRPMPREDEK